MRSKISAANERELLLRRLTSNRPLSTSDERLLGELTWRSEDKPARTQFVQEGDRPTESCLLVQGTIVRSRYAEDGRRQILSVHIPGDMPDLQSLHLERMDYGLETIGASRVAFVPHSALNAVFARSSSLSATFWRETLVDAALYRTAIFRNALLDASARLANFICEMHIRHQTVGLIDENGFHLALSQEGIGEVLGLTNVSVNRSAQQLRAQGLIRMDRGQIQVLNFKVLAKLGQFDTTYLHLPEVAMSPRRGSSDRTDREKRLG